MGSPQVFWTRMKTHPRSTGYCSGWSLPVKKLFSHEAVASISLLLELAMLFRKCEGMETDVT